MKAFEPDRVVQAELIMKLRGLGITDKRLLSAMETIPRKIFVPASCQSGVYLDRAIPIECGQIMNAPSSVAMALDLLGVEPSHIALEVGCGSGYQTAILAHLAGRVVAIDRYHTLVDLADDRLASLRLDNVTAVVADGFDGMSRHAPYDRILVDGAVEKVPTALLDQLADHGVLVAPVGKGPRQTLMRIVREGRLFHRSEHGPVRTLPLVEGTARRL